VEKLIPRGMVRKATNIKTDSTEREEGTILRFGAREVGRKVAIETLREGGRAQ